MSDLGDVSPEVLMLHKKVASSISNSDFDGIRSVGHNLLGADYRPKEFSLLGRYLTAEAGRLQSTVDRAFVSIPAQEGFEHCLEEGYLVPSSLRGLARLYEENGDFSSSQILYDTARRMIYEEDNLYHLYAHELLRTERHRLVCLVKQFETRGTTSELHRLNVLRDFESCIDLHRRILARYRRATSWYWVEKFMSYMALAKVCRFLRDEGRLRRYLAAAACSKAMHIRHKLEPNMQDVHNIRWLCDTCESLLAPEAYALHGFIKSLLAWRPPDTAPAATALLLKLCRKVLFPAWEGTT